MQDAAACTATGTKGRSNQGMEAASAVATAAAAAAAASAFDVPVTAVGGAACVEDVAALNPAQTPKRWPST